MSFAILRRISAIARRLRVDRHGNILAIVAGAMVPMTLSVGFGIDYARAMRLQSQMNAAADAAALAGVTGPMMGDTSNAGQTSARAAAVAMFKGQVANLTDVVFNADATNTAFNASNDLVVTPSYLPGSLNAGRKVVVQWRARSRNIFSSILGADTLAISGVASSQATKAPYINFYLMMDVSPSMLLPTTSTGLQAISKATTNSAKPYGCAFACHTQNPHADSIYVRDTNGRDVFLEANYYNSGHAGYGSYFTVDTTQGKVYNSSGTVASAYTYSNGNIVRVAAGTKVSGYWADGYWLTHNYSSAYPGNSNLEVRIDAERLAAQQLIPYATGQAAGNGVTYKMQMFSFDWTHPGATSPVKALTSSMADVSTLSASSVPDLYAAQDYWLKNNQPFQASSNGDGDKGTEVHTMFTTMNTLMGDSGDGRTASTPQKVMFLITDGVADENINGSRWNREFYTTHLADCAAIKARGVLIAILYTQYLPDSLTGDSWSQSSVAPYLPNVAPALKSCASPGSDGTPLFFQVTTDQNISDALVTLFALTVQQAHLVQ